MCIFEPEQNNVDTVTASRVIQSCFEPNELEFPSDDITESAVTFFKFSMDCNLNSCYP